MPLEKLPPELSKQFARLYLAYSDRILATLRYLVGYIQCLEDIYQDCILKLIGYADVLVGLDKPAALKYINKTINTVVADYFRKERTKKKYMVEDWERILVKSYCYGDPERKLMSKEWKTLLDDLDENQKEVMLRRLCYGMDYRTIGRALCISPATARKRFERGIKRLSNTFGKEYLYEIISTC